MSKNLFCRILGHKHKPHHYGKVNLTEVDGLNTRHADVYARCWRRFEYFFITRIHVPKLEPAVQQNTAPLAPDFENAFPDGTRDKCSYSDVETALDLVDAPVRNGNRWLTLPERIAAIVKPTAKSKSRIVQHKKRGSTYTVVGLASLQTSQPIKEGTQLTIYQGEVGDLWARPTSEFEDGRFIDVDPTQQTTGKVE